jgi:hypothetical protein
MLFAARPNDVLLLLFGARSRQTQNIRLTPGLNSEPLLTGARAIGYDDAEPGRVALLWSSDILRLELLILQNESETLVH